ncbi:putative glycolipid-binding domain-containing protein [Arenibacter sp. M-2]|uniref:putative glycolipid-binding domain-containing protein n=1 Tax=Arenibacter sp. M-2 TaxID=3053612 RepID=UPI002570462F|nr:putative glycolipid-binding domain-containing protein [Arenibacter sp. M-2]MDL5514883.1 putative glycolipid-binding domain-containing protein [Arenibacter sp. M-2]
MAQEKIIVWKSTYVNTTEFTTINLKDTIVVKGHITGQGLGKLLNVNYLLEINEKWEIQSVNINLQSDSTFNIWLSKNKKNHWVNEKGEILKQLNNCTDIDISLTPFTNTLPINRLGLAVGESKEIEVVYFELPANKFSPVQQRYTNLGNGIYKYESLVSGFTANLQVDKDGLVLNYPDIWHRVFNEQEIVSREKEIFASSLISEKASSEIETNDIYNWLIGSWNVDAIDYLDNKEVITSEGEWHFAYVLEGRVVQDVWIAPKRSLRTPNLKQPRNRYGSTIRYFDTESKKWCIHWFNPVSSIISKLYGWKENGKIVHEGNDENGNILRWTFQDITDKSFHWKGEFSTDNGKTFTLQAEFFGTRK